MKRLVISLLCFFLINCEEAEKAQCEEKISHVEMTENNTLVIGGREVDNLLVQYQSESGILSLIYYLPKFLKGKVKITSRIWPTWGMITLYQREDLPNKKFRNHSRPIMSWSRQVEGDSFDPYVAIVRNLDDPEKMWDVIWGDSIMVLSQREMCFFSQKWSNASNMACYRKNLNAPYWQQEDESQIKRAVYYGDKADQLAASMKELKVDEKKGEWYYYDEEAKEFWLKDYPNLEHSIHEAPRLTRISEVPKGIRKLTD